MKQVCAVCRHDQRLEIEAEALEGGTLQFVSEKYGLHKTQLWRHMNKHVPKAIEKARSDMEAALDIERVSGMSALEQVGDLQNRARRILNDAEADRDRSDALKAIRELRRLAELLGRFSGEGIPADRDKPTVVYVTTRFEPATVVDAEFCEEVD
jgi:hypothetical protein